MTVARPHGAPGGPSQEPAQEPAQGASRDPSRGPWNPGIESTLPRAFLPLATVHRPENVLTPLARAQELSAFSGLSLTEVVAFRPERLAVHETLIRVMADLSVPVGETYGDLGVNFRAIVATILGGLDEAQRAAVAETYDAVRAQVARRVAAELDAALAPAEAPPPARRSWLGRLGIGGREAAAARGQGRSEERALDRLRGWQARAAADPLEAAASAALLRVVSTLVRHRGALMGERALLADLAVTLTMNDLGSRRIGALIEPWFDAAVAREGYDRLRPQAEPVVMNVKGASASGKSTMRPRQRDLAERLGLAWSDFAVITPDIFRKYLLDYDSIGPATGYAGTLTGHELEIVDRKLDGYMARKAREGRVSHLLIDRFRFDSFSAESGAQDGSQLLTRFGHRVFMLFMITPPEATVERAWGRGEQFGRYKAVDDLLAHNVEAFAGMPELFFTWALAPGKDVTYEFLDNSVALGEPPRSVAFGTGAAMTVLDLRRVLDVDRFRKINVEATAPAEVYPSATALAPERNTGFLRACARRMASLRFAEQASGRVYARYAQGRLACLDRAAFTRALEDPDARAAFAAIGGARPEAVPDADGAETLSPAATLTVGAWGGGPPVRRSASAA